MLSKREIENLSRRLLAAYLRQLERPPERIDPIDFSEKMCGLHFKTADLTRLGNVLGLTSGGDIEIKLPGYNGRPQVLALDGRTAYIDHDLACSGNRGRLNFTMMHETAHHLLAEYFPAEYGNMIYRSPWREKRGERAPVETQTNSLASYLLMPRELVCKTMRELGINRRLTPEDRIYKTSGYDNFITMADRLGVSMTALSIRLNQLGFMDGELFPAGYRRAIDVFISDKELATEELWQG